ncbi:MAG TPA: hypothetical protein ENK85_09520 [Saprospiraceae bacterium]|nr:hypothetical protein [Saprospiraceae bacterium]
MIKFKIRPRVNCVTPMTKEEIYTRFSDFLKRTDKPILGKKLKHHIELRVSPEERHYWSPVLNITFKKADQGTTVLGRFGPQPKVWTLFMFFYFFALAICFFAGLYTLVQLQLGYRPWSIWVLLAGIALLILVYVAAQIGQHKGHEQTEWLMTFCSEVLRQENIRL